ncbi:unnamed protein product [Urochloa decumbens]|uniref:Fe2OG dioxygenase domain-containing protein n=1 Tax=Urochloa decumbens TaxID=240449 RepID=A0ABC9HB13_9POAL
MDLIDGTEQRVPGIRRVDVRGVEPSSRGWEEARAVVAAPCRSSSRSRSAPSEASSPAPLTGTSGQRLRRRRMRACAHGRPPTPAPSGTSATSSGRTAAILRSASDTVSAFAVNMLSLQRRVGAMVLESLGVGQDSVASHLDSLNYSVRLSRYGVSEAGDGMPCGFCRLPDTVSAFAVNMLSLQRRVGAMVLESLGVGQDSVASHLDSLNYSVRLSRYGVSEAGDGMLVKPHRGCTVLSVVVQHDVEGLEVQAQDRSWLAVAPEADTVAVVAGKLLAVSVTASRTWVIFLVACVRAGCEFVTNGRVPACVHRVSAPSGRERLSAQFVSKPKDGHTVRPLDELVDADHPPLYNPCDFDGYVWFRFAGEGRSVSEGIVAHFSRSEPTTAWRHLAG